MDIDIDIDIRPATRDDVDALVALIVGGKLVSDEDGAEHRADYVDAMQEIESDPHSEVLVAVEWSSGGSSGEVIAMLQWFTFRHVQHRGGRCAEIESMHVRHDLRGTGIGGRLLDEAVDRARRIGCYRVQLTSNVDRPDAHRFYERHGFVASHQGFKKLLV